MPSPPLRVVLDTNILVRGLSNMHAPSGLILQACGARAIIPLISLPVISEYRTVLTDAAVVRRYPQLEEHRVRTAIERLCYVGDFVRVLRTRFQFPRDPKDAKFIELAIAGRATHLVTTDLDLLDLPAGRLSASKRFRQLLPSIHVMKPDAFTVEYPSYLPG